MTMAVAKRSIIPKRSIFMNAQHDLTNCWIRAKDNLPDVCCSCGMFTDNRVKLKFKRSIEVEGSGAGATIFVILMHVLLGPIGWLIGMAAGHGKEDEKRTVKKTYRIPVSQCRLCNGAQTPEVIESRPEAGEYLIAVHPEFERRLSSSRREAAAESERNNDW